MPKWAKLAFMQAKLALAMLKSEGTIKLSRDDKKLLTEIRDLLDALIGD